MKIFDITIHVTQARVHSKTIAFCVKLFQKLSKDGVPPWVAEPKETPTVVVNNQLVYGSFGKESTGIKHLFHVGNINTVFDGHSVVIIAPRRQQHSP